VDITLDTFPFNGHTTTCDTLWQGVPVVALAGNTYCSRFGSSALVNLGLESLIAVSTPQYIQIAIELAQDRARLARMRAELRETMRNSAIVDAKTFTRNLEAAYRQMWTDWCNKPVGP
jgi:protein O-GlcNAc transferase